MLDNLHLPILVQILQHLPISMLLKVALTSTNLAMVVKNNTKNLLKCHYLRLYGQIPYSFQRLPLYKMYASINHEQLRLYQFVDRRQKTKSLPFAFEDLRDAQLPLQDMTNLFQACNALSRDFTFSPDSCSDFHWTSIYLENVSVAPTPVIVILVDELARTHAIDYNSELPLTSASCVDFAALYPPYEGIGAQYE